MGKSSAPAPMPDFAGIAAANAAAQNSALMGQISQQQLAWAREQYAQDKETLAPIIERMIGNMDLQNEFARDQRALYGETYRPIEEGLARTAVEFDTPERREAMAGEAAADVAQQFEGARIAAEQSLKDFGVDPSSPKYAATNLGARLSQAAASAGAQNQARRNTEMTGIALRQNAVNTGRGFAGAVTDLSQGGTRSGSAAAGNVFGMTESGAQTMGTGAQYAGLQNQAIGTWGNTAAANYGNFLEGYKFSNAPRSSGIGSALGLIGGIGARMKLGMADGGAVPEEASPSGGAAVDDVPARVNVGEFIMPKEAVSWFGEKAMHDMILKAQKQRTEMEQQSGAVPDVAMAVPERPTLTSRAQPAALPMG